jgi:DNA-binding HxlR family transcriptional regulator
MRVMAERENQFDASRAELFEALGHPARVQILRALQRRPLGFAELKREVGIESSGHLQFHLGKLTGLIITTPEGVYTLTDEGREAIRVLNTTTGSGEIAAKARTSPLKRTHLTKLLLTVLLVALVVLAGTAVYQQQQIGGLNNELRTRTSSSSSTNTSSSTCFSWGFQCESLVVNFQMTATIAPNGSILFAGVVTNNGRDPATGMRILVNGTECCGNDTYWETTFSPGYPTLGGEPLASGSSVTFHARLKAGAPPAWPVACQSFRCSAGDKLLIEVDLFGANSSQAAAMTYITIGTE